MRVGGGEHPASQQVYGDQGICHPGAVAQEGPAADDRSKASGMVQAGDVTPTVRLPRR